MSKQDVIDSVGKIVTELEGLVQQNKILNGDISDFIKTSDLSFGKVLQRVFIQSAFELNQTRDKLDMALIEYKKD